MGRIAALLALMVPVGCAFSDALPPGAQVICTNNDDCLDGEVCQALIARCVRSDGSDVTPPQVLEPSLTPERLGGADTLEVRFLVDEPLLLAPVVDAATATTDAIEAADGAWQASFPAAELAEGFVPVTVALVDSQANVAVAVLGIVEVDRTPPVLDPTSVTWEVLPPPGSAPVQPTALTLGSTAELSLAMDDPSAVVERVVARNANGDELALALREHVEQRWSFTLLLEGGAVPGDYGVFATLVDELGNGVEVEVPLPPPGCRVDEVIGGVCLARHDDGSAACTDLDADGAFGAGAGCDQATDCDDSRSLVHPGAVEVPGNGLDDDCDGYQPPLNADAGVFVAPTGRAGAAGTPDDPLADLGEAALRQGPIFVQRGTYALPGLPFTSSIFGGLDEDWRPTATPSVVVGAGTGIALLVDVSATPLRLEGLHVQGPSCSVLSLHGSRIELGRLRLETTGAVCGLDAFPSAIGFEAEHLLAAQVSVAAHYDDAPIAGANGVSGMGALTLVDSDFTLTGGTRAVLGSTEVTTTVVRSRIDVTLDFDGPAFGVESQGPLVVVSSDVQVRSLGAVAGLLATSLLVAQSTVRAPEAANLATCFVAQGALTALSNRFESTASGRGASGAELRLIANAFDEAMADCVVQDETQTCLDVDTLHQCAFAACIEAHDNVVATAGVPAPGAAVLDDGAPSTLAMDADGDCRGASAVEAGADEQS